MTIVFENKEAGKFLKVENVSRFYTSEKDMFGKTGFAVYFNDGSYDFYPVKEWRLISVAQ